MGLLIPGSWGQAPPWVFTKKGEPLLKVRLFFQQPLRAAFPLRTGKPKFKALKPKGALPAGRESENQALRTKQEK